MNTDVDGFVVDLPADTTAPRLARTTVADQVGDDPRLQDLLLCVSEVVTNAVLHARSPGELRVRREGDRLVVEVTDGDPRLPARRQHDLQAPTGRGLHLLDALTRSWGTSPLEGGKVVWFEFDLASTATAPADEPEATRPFRLLGLPIAVHRRATEHSEALRRELSLVAHTTTPDRVLIGLRDIGREMGARFGGLNDPTEARLAEALVGDEDAVDLEYRLPIAAAEAFERLEELVDELDRYCADRDLLTLVTPPESLAYRRWWMREIIEQLRDGRPARRWQAPDLAGPDDAAGAAGTARAAGDRDGATVATILVEGDLDLELAATLRDELVQRTEAGATDLVVDLAGCDFMDSTGLSLLVTTQLRLRSEGGSLRLTNLTPQVTSILELSGLTDVMT